MYDIPEKIFEQYNRAQMSTRMGLFADLNHAWVAIDNALYLWDYTQPDPPLIGYEEQPHNITAVQMIQPRAGVFLPAITRMLVIATSVDMHIVGVAPSAAPTGGQTITLYSTNMKQPTKGMDIRVIAGSASTGRIFFSSKENDDVHELTYLQEEKWFRSRLAKINHTRTGLSTFDPIPFLGLGARTPQETVVDMVVDDTRGLLYTLSSRSAIRVFQLNPNDGLSLVITRPFSSTFNDISHMLSAQTPTDLITINTQIVAIQPISAREASKMHLMATTATGCRIFMSATSTSYYSITRQQSAPNSMQVVHVKFPPPDSIRSSTSQSQASAQLGPYGNNQNINTLSKALNPTRKAARFPPGYFFSFVPADGQQRAKDLVFASAPDTGRIARPQDASKPVRYPELGLWVDLGNEVQAIGLISPPFAAASTPFGFANELAVQFDAPSSEIAILTNTGVHTLRRRRLVDMFATTIKFGGGDGGLESEIKKFIRLYGRGETASTALAVACGQGLDVTADSRIAKITDPEVLEFARKAFIEYGGKPQFFENMLVDQNVAAIDMVHPSPRHEGLAMYVARLVRLIWKSPIIRETTTPTGGLSVLPVISTSKLQSTAQDLQRLKEFLDTNKSFISGLGGSGVLDRASTKQEEISLQAEHRALYSQLVLVDNVIEGIAFVQVLFDERLDEIMLALGNEMRQQVRDLTYEGLFSTGPGKDVAKELVKAIVNRNIANGSNVETVAEALRRRCGSFCSADDVVIFKAQENLKRASESGSESELGRNLLNESLRLFTQVSSSLNMEQLQWAIQNFTALQFYAGAIQLALSVAYESDRGNKALAWIQEGRPDQVSAMQIMSAVIANSRQDPKAAAFIARKRCYNLIHDVINVIDQSPQAIDDGQYSLVKRRKQEAYEVIDNSDDEAFQTDLYDWYLSQGRTDRILEIQSPYIVTYLQRKSSDDIAQADLLWRYHTQNGQNHQAAEVQLSLAKSNFSLTLDKRIEYLGRAKASASTPSPGVSRHSRHLLLREISDLLDLASIQSDLLQRLRNDDRISVDRRPSLVDELNGQILTLTVLYNQYADQASYYDLCLLIYQIADHRVPTNIRSTWQNLLERTHEEAVQQISAGNSSDDLPYQKVANQVRSLGHRLNLDETFFPIPDILPLLEQYSLEYSHTVQRQPTSTTSETPRNHWVIETLVDIGVPYESLYPVLESMYYNDTAPFQGRNRRYVVIDLLYVVALWLQSSDRGSRGAGKILGGEQNAAEISQTLQAVLQNGGRGGIYDNDLIDQCRNLRMQIEQILR